MPFSIGPGELVLVLVILLVVVGPGRLPSVGSALGRSIREFRSAATDGDTGEPGAAPPATPG